ncbi:LLM class flavin-dependent oxidoreductase [Dactylosporangium sp. NPDC000244]|uniref:LLM class flavin-dependent oxidoreductase n=1 Tax=Dactylosporangium sp. NPDC000244 TaxID=3154365 RepID=UPI003316EFDE
MTAEPHRGAGPADSGPAPRIDLFLLAGLFPGRTHADALGAAVDYAMAAERAGFDGVWLAEHHFSAYGTCPSAVTLAGHLLGRTARLRVGTAAAILPTRHPVALAEETALLDAVSGGRFDLGVARGGPWVDLEVFGTGLDRYGHDGFAAALDLLLAGLSGAATITGDGDRFPFREVPMVPIAARRPPVWVAATGPSTVELAAARGLPLLLGMHDADNTKTGMLHRYCAHSAGAPPPGHASTHLALVADTVEEAETVLRRTMPGWLATAGGSPRLDGTAPPRRDLAAYLEHLLAIHPVGPPERCVRRLAATIGATGVRRLLLMVEGAGEPARTLANIERLGREVLPPLRRLH